MAKADAYEKANGREIRKRRKIRDWSPEDLAREAGIGVSTVKRAERGLMMQLRNLSKIATALKVGLGEIAPRQNSARGVQVLDRWGHEYGLIAQARVSVLVIDSYFSEYGRLGSALRARSRTQREPLDVEIFMASPDYDFGAQRFREMTSMPVFRSTKGGPQPLSDQLTDKQREDYEFHFHYLEQGAMAAAQPYAGSNEHPGSVKIYEYRCMPGLRIVVIDNFHFIFGWFPLFAQNPAHTCFYLRDENLEGADAALLDDINMQIKNVKEASVPALARDQRPRTNRGGVSQPTN